MISNAFFSISEQVMEGTKSLGFYGSRFGWLQKTSGRPSTGALPSEFQIVTEDDLEHFDPKDVDDQLLDQTDGDEPVVLPEKFAMEEIPLENQNLTDFPIGYLEGFQITVQGINFVFCQQLGLDFVKNAVEVQRLNSELPPQCCLNPCSGQGPVEVIIRSVYWMFRLRNKCQYYSTEEECKLRCLHKPNKKCAFHDKDFENYNKEYKNTCVLPSEEKPYGPNIHLFNSELFSFETSIMNSHTIHISDVTFHHI